MCVILYRIAAHYARMTICSNLILKETVLPKIKNTVDIFLLICSGIYPDGFGVSCVKFWRHQLLRCFPSLEYDGTRYETGTFEFNISVSLQKS